MPQLDRTYSDKDVVRIYEKHLTPDEQLLVESFFGGQPEGFVVLNRVEAQHLFTILSLMDRKSEAKWMEGVFLAIQFLVEQLREVLPLEAFVQIASGAREASDEIQSIIDRQPGIISDLFGFALGNAILLFDLVARIFDRLGDGLIAVEQLMEENLFKLNVVFNAVDDLDDVKRRTMEVL